MRATGTFRLHFNRHGAAPLVWCVAADDWELAVKSVVVSGTLATVYRPKETADDDDGKPSAWLEVSGVLEVREGHAAIVASPPPRCECDGSVHGDRGCIASADMTITRNGSRLKVCDRCEVTGDTDRTFIVENP